jgi:hypothetical protein
MNFERSDILKPLLDDLEANDRGLLRSVQQRVLAGITAARQGMGPAAIAQVVEALKSELTKRGDDLLVVVQRVFEDHRRFAHRSLRVDSELVDKTNSRDRLSA